MNLFRLFGLVTGLLLIVSCSIAQSGNEKPSDIEIVPGNKLVDTEFFKPFTASGKVLENTSAKTDKIFRLMEMKMDFTDFEGSRVIFQELQYQTETGKRTGAHTTYYDPATFQVLYWEYKAATGNTHFAFKANGDSISGTQDPDAKNVVWQTAKIGLKLFQNETRELLFRSLKTGKGSAVRFPVIGAKPPFHGWVSYEYSRDEEIVFAGKKYVAKVWQTPNGKKGAYYLVISDPPYVIRRGIIGNPAGSHTFRFENVDFD